MNKKLALSASVLLIVMLLAVSAMADTISFNATVQPKDKTLVYAPIGGLVDRVLVEAGDYVNAGDTLIELRTEKVYATENGTITGIFAQPGDSVDSVVSRYGAVMYLEGKARFTVSATTDNAYNSVEARFVQVGEFVYLRSRSDSAHTGTGRITAVNGTSYTIEVQTGALEVGESVDVYRNTNMESSTRIGRGDVARVNPVVMGGSGAIVSIAVENGQKVNRGDVLYETLTGSFDGLYVTGTSVKASVSGVIGQINATEGSQLQKNAIAAIIYNAGSMRLKGSVNETDLRYVNVGDQVAVELIWMEDEEITVPGVISAISAVSVAEGTNVTFPVYIDFMPDATTRYGMSAVINTLDRTSLIETNGRDAK